MNAHRRKKMAKMLNAEQKKSSQKTEQQKILPIGLKELAAEVEVVEAKEEAVTEVEVAVDVETKAEEVVVVSEPEFSGVEKSSSKKKKKF